MENVVYKIQINPSGILKYGLLSIGRAKFHSGARVDEN